ELFLKGSREGMILAVAQNAAQLLDCEQLAARAPSHTRPRREPPGRRVPAELAKLSRTPTTIRRPAPGIGEHTSEIRSEMAGPRGDLRGTVPPRPSQPPGR